MTSTEINTTLAGVEGWKEVRTNGGSNNVWGISPETGNFIPIPDYTTSLDPCMRVARKLKLEVTYVRGCGWEIVEQFKPSHTIISMIKDLDNPALTLATMLAEIVKEQP